MCFSSQACLDCEEYFKILSTWLTNAKLWSKNQIIYSQFFYNLFQVRQILLVPDKSDPPVHRTSLAKSLVKSGTMGI
jgi:hypothetical protein